MPVNIFDLDFSRSDVLILSLVPALINIGIYVYLVFNFHKTRTILFFSSFVLLIGLWQAAEGFMRMSKNPEAAESWYRISMILLLLAMPFGIEFVLRLMKNAQKIKANFLSPILFIVPIALFIFIESGLEKHTIIPSENWYWIANPVPNVYTYLLLFWIAFNGLLMLFLLWLHYTNNKTNELIKKQAFLLLIGLAGPVIIGVTVEIFLPAIFKMNDIPITTPLVTVFSICALITISKYNIFDYSPKHQWERIIANLNDAILIVNNDDKVMYANDSFCQLLGYEFEEVKGKNASEMFLFPEHKENTKKIIEERKLNKTSSYELPMMTKSKETIWTLISGSPYMNQDGKVIGSIGVHTNITGLKSINKELETFIYKASHDLRGPLASIIGLVSVSKMEGPTKDSEKYLDMIETASKKLDSTLTDLVKAMQIKEAVKFRDKIDFDKIINDILNRFCYYPGYSALKISIEILVEEEILSNRLIIETILQNLIENSIKYQSTDIPQPILNINVKHCSDKVEIVIEDNGIGIEESVQSKIFDMYFRATNSAKGTGLGLYLVKNGIDKLRGKIELFSKPGEKTIFKVSIPVYK